MWFSLIAKFAREFLRPSSFALLDSFRRSRAGRVIQADFAGHRADCRITGQIFSYPVRHTWEFTADNPIRSVFPLWPVYGLPMLLLRWLWIGNGNDGEIPPNAVFWTLRVLMFIISFVLEDWAIHELVQKPRNRRLELRGIMSAKFVSH